MKAHQILEAGLGHMKDRSATYDKPAGERSMGATVDAFRAITGHDLTEEQGWLFMGLLKMVRSQQGGFRADNYEDLAAYAGLQGEAAWAERANSDFGQQNTLDYRDPRSVAGSVDRCDEILRGLAAEADWDAAEARMNVVGQNGPSAEHYAEVPHE